MSGSEPEGEDGFVKHDPILLRGVYMLVFLLLFELSKTLIWVIALAQFVWMIFAGRPNDHIAEFGARLGVWLKRTSLYLSGTSEEKPFPWREID